MYIIQVIQMQVQTTNKEFHFSSSDFSALASLVYDRTGIVLGEHKKDMVYSRLTKRLRELNFTNFADYLTLLQDKSDESEVEQLINAITTNLTRFFRENHHFDHVKDIFIPQIQSKGQREIRIWSAACASGPEPYSIAMTAYDALGRSQQYNLKILATDLDTKMLETAKSGIYDASIHKDIPVNLRNKYTSFTSNDRNNFVISQEIKKLISFNRLNLMKEWPHKTLLDAIFCRNVLIYFNKEDKNRIITQLVNKLKAGGFLYMGHAESLMDMSLPVKSVGTTTYVKVE